jgi:hypothetical protein
MKESRGCSRRERASAGASQCQTLPGEPVTPLIPSVHDCEEHAFFEVIREMVQE